jgi:pre-mRNA-processing factor SLU7
MTHKVKDCMERPRKNGARWTNQEIAPDEVVSELDLTYDGKRDRWNGYDPNEYTKVTKG